MLFLEGGLGRGDRIGRWNEYGGRSKGKGKGLRHLPEFTGSDIHHHPHHWDSPALGGQTKGGQTPVQGKAWLSWLTVSLSHQPLSQDELTIPLQLLTSIKSILKTYPPHLRDFPSLAGTRHKSSSMSLGRLWPWVSVNSPFHTENSPYISFKTFYSTIYTFTIITSLPIMPYMPPFPAAESVVCWETGGHRTHQGRRGATVTNHFAYPSHFPCSLGQEEVNRKPKACEPFTFGSEV